MPTCSTTADSSGEPTLKEPSRSRRWRLATASSPGVSSRSIALTETATRRATQLIGATASFNTEPARVRHDSNGDNVELRPFIVADPTAVQRLQVSSFNTLIGFNLLVSIEWDATADEIRRYTDRILEMSELLYNCTDGQFLVDRVTIVDNRRYWDDADIRIYANLNQRSQADVGAIFSSGGRIHMNPNNTHEPSVTLHELGHYTFNVYDEYKAGSGWEESDGPPICTFASESDGTDYSAGGSKDSCLMRGARNAEIKKICSTNAANPHATTTRQGAKDCWSEIIENSGDRYWRLRTPSTSGAITDVFPDSGVPLATSTSPPAGVGTVASYIPIEDWKPIRRTSSVTRADECPDRLVHVELDGSPHDDVKVSLESGAVTTYQGVARNTTWPTTSAAGQARSASAAHTFGTASQRSHGSTGRALSLTFSSARSTSKTAALAP